MFEKSLKTGSWFRYTNHSPIAQTLDHEVDLAPGISRVWDLLWTVAIGNQLLILSRKLPLKSKTK